MSKMLTAIVYARLELMPIFLTIRGDYMVTKIRLFP